MPDTTVGVAVQDSQDLVQIAAAAEAAGYNYLTCGEHLQFHGPTPNAFIRLAVAAAATKHIRLMSSVTLAPLYAPAILAKLVAELAVVSNGRFELGMGVGGENPSEFEAVDIQTSTRGKRTDVAIDLVRGLLDPSGESQLGIAPAPATVPTVWVAGRAEAALRRTATRGDGWIPYMVTPAQYRVGVERLDELNLAATGSCWRGRLGIFLFVSLSTTRESGRALMIERLSKGYNADMSRAIDRFGIFGTPDQCLEQISQYLEVGVDTVIARPIGIGPATELNTELYEQILVRVQNRSSESKLAAAARKGAKTPSAQPRKEPLENDD